MKSAKDFMRCDKDILITGITDDSRLVKPGYIFVATKGYNVDHYDFIDDAIENGCSLVIADRKLEKKFPHLIVENINDYYIELCKNYYDVELEKFRFIGITGTDGKTTTTTIVREVIGDCAYIGTNGLEVSGKEYPVNNTTPCIEELYKTLHIIDNYKCKNVSMEVSSEALLHDRVKGISFDIIGITNITGDHIEVHGSFENYVKCKLRILECVKNNGYVVINGDDDNLRNINCNNLYKFGFNKDNDCVIENVKYSNNSTVINIKFLNKEIEIVSPLLGKYNVYNVTMAFLIGYFFGIDESLLLERIKNIKSIKGRCEFLDFGQNYDIVLDYAHTINGVKSILETFKSYDNVIVVSGSAGGRDKEKRKIIGKTIIENSDVTIFTMDDPRFEDVDEIIDQMAGDFKDYYRIKDREDAIKYALSIAKKGSVVLILGKGRDNYMAIGDKKIHYSDYEVISNYFSK